MNFDDRRSDAQNIKYHYRGVKEILDSLLQTPIGIHQIVVYPSNIEMLRELYSHYINRLLEDSNEMVIFLPYHESSESVKNILDLFNSNMDKNNDNKNNNDKNIINIKKLKSSKSFFYNITIYMLEAEDNFTFFLSLDSRNSRCLT